MKYKFHKVHLKSAAAVGGNFQRARYTLQGNGLGGTIKKGIVRVDYLNSTATGHSAHFRPQDVTFNLKVKSPSIPFTDPGFNSDSTTLTVNKHDSTIQVLNNNRGDGTHFSYYNEQMGIETGQGRKFEMFNTANPLTIELYDSNDDLADNLDPYYLGLTFIEILDDDCNCT